MGRTRGKAHGQQMDDHAGLQNGLRDNGEDLEDDQERDGATTSLGNWGRPGHV